MLLEPGRAGFSLLLFITHLMVEIGRLAGHDLERNCRQLAEKG